jgi:DNA N-6-adenine-methyltransferase (Dam)/ASCH domain
MTETLISPRRPLVKSSGGNFEVRKFQVGDRVALPPRAVRVTTQPTNLNAHQHLPGVTGTIQELVGEKALVIIDTPFDEGGEPNSVWIELCSLTRISLPDSESLVSLPPKLESQPTYAASGTNSVKKPCKKTSPVSSSVETSPISTQQPTTEPLISLLEECHVRPLVDKEDSWQAQTIATDSQTSCELSQDADPSGYVSKMSPDYLTLPLFQVQAEVHSLETYSGNFPKSGTWGNGWFSAQPNLGYPTIEKDCLSLPTPTALSSLNSRPPGQTKLEVKLKELGMIQRGEVANPEFLEAMFGLPLGYSSPAESRAETVSTDAAAKPSVIPSASKQLLQPLEESSTSTVSSKAISLWQPWASLIPLGLKHYETRSWKTEYRGKLLICSTAVNSKQHKEYLKICDELGLPAWSDFPHGKAIAVCDLVDCVPMTAEFIASQSRTEILCGDWQVGRYAWKLENIQPITEPFAVKGKQGLFNVVTNLQLLPNEENQKPTAVDPQLLTPDSQPPKSHTPIDAASCPEETNRKGKSKPSDRCYTPPNIIELIVRVLGAIDLDPCADDGKHVPALLHYTAADDGLSKPWHGRVFFNPPYSCPGKWVAWFLQEYAAGRATEAIALLPAATDTNWMFPILKAQPVCFWKGRIKFLDENYQPMRSGARQSHVLVYWGDAFGGRSHRVQLFKEVFDEYGVVQLPTTFLLDKISSRKTRRHKGDGSGCIYWRTVIKKGKEYREAYYQYEFWSNGNVVVKSTKYIPKRLLPQIQKLDTEKAPVHEILEVLGIIV